MPFDQGCGDHGGASAWSAAAAGLSDRPEACRRRLRGAVAHHSGRVAEEQVEALYLQRGHAVAARRWRGRSGEIDLVLRDGANLIFVEVKRADSHATAAERLSTRQMGRICAAASEFVAGEPAGQDTDMRFDVALVDSAGRIAIVENAIGV